MSMYITNPSSLSNTYKCNKRIAQYLINQHKIPLLSQKDGVFYFTRTDKLQNIIDNLPLWLKIFK